MFHEFKTFISRGNVLALKAAGVPLFGYGAFVTAAVNFLIVAFIIFLLVRAVNRIAPKATPVVVEDSADVVLLREIRDELRSGRGSSAAS